jgi:hypothetical protein
MKFLSGLAALLCMTAPATAKDTDRALFRADPKAWVRNTIMPGCNAPADADTFAQCACMVPLLAAEITEADVARVNEPDFIKQKFLHIAFGAGALCYHRSYSR